MCSSDLVFAIFQCLVICVSMGLGPTMVAALNEWIAMGQGDLRLALRLNTAGLTLVSGVVLLAGSGAYRRSLAGRLTATT